MKNVFKFLTLVLVFGFLTTSCSDDDDNFVNPPVALGDYENGIFVSAEGGTLSGSVSFISNDFSNAETNVFFNVNAEELGTYVQSMGINDNNAYVVVDNNNIHVVNRYSFIKEATISAGLELPRFIAFAGGNGYVTNWGDPTDSTDDFIAVVDLATNAVIDTIPVEEGPEQILSVGNKLYVSHKGGYGSNNIVSVINVSNADVSTILVNDVPDEMIINNSGQLVVLCEGKAAWTGDETPASISKIDLSSNTVVETLTFANGVHPSVMGYTNGKVYYQSGNEIFELSDSASSLPSTSIINLGAISPYGMSVKDDKLYVTDAKDFVSLSDLIVYDLNTKSVIHTFEVGLIASKIYFN
ncbi:YncE family protein [Xanthomarina sp. F2636L]|uniref:YncE family protein n=1 Tax=Xanthomarina sp. F2636L TaxID=2996018 RepID=UPI00225DEB96|nr:YncE family protein [Xanthomarina sp. F2636L]MCX7550198.1 YncE family protein [Xanthomarina sp. F2636L]